MKYLIAFAVLLIVVAEEQAEAAVPMQPVPGYVPLDFSGAFSPSVHLSSGFDPDQYDPWSENVFDNWYVSSPLGPSGG